jgi:phosphopantothenoylcysteine decarboxylase/phosphopantothenate--cysteine ligase
VLVVLGISGGIAAYKACEIVRGLDVAGIETQVLLTRNAARFVSPLTLQALSRRPVLQSLFDARGEETIRHIELSRRTAALVVAPATANVLAKFAGGIADDLLSTFSLSVTAPVLLAPAMNTRMLQHGTTQQNLARLRASGARILDPGTGWLAEGEIGWGRMAEPAAIVGATVGAVRRSRQLEGQSVVVTAGPTREAIDPVRFLSSRSSGKMGYALAAACARRAARVVLISGPVELGPPYGVERVLVETSAQMREAVLGAAPGASAVFMTAAVSDYVAQPAPVKIKRDGSPLTLTLEEGPDILAELGRGKRAGLLVGFAAETDDLLANARRKLEAKHLDFIVANDVSRPGLGIGADDNAVTILGRAGERWEHGPASKTEIAEAILDRIFGGGEDRA